MVLQEDFASLFEKSLTRALPQEGEVVKGAVVAINKDFAIIDFGYKQEGQVPLSEFNTAQGELGVKIGDEVEAYLETLESPDGFVLLSKEKAAAFKIWDRLQEAFDTEGEVDGTVVAKVKGGLSIDIGVKAFLPASQIDVRPPGNLDRLLHRKFRVKILKLNKKKGNIIVSRRILLEKNREFAKQEVLGNLSEGEVVSGAVKNLTDYGAFIDLGGLDGLLHITDISWSRIGHPSEVLSSGQELQVKVLKIDQESGRVSLGLKQLTADPWQKVPEKYPIGSQARGRVVNVTDYGAFIELEEGIEGLVHISEMSWSRKAKHPSKIVSVGDFVDAVVLDLDREAHKISLGMKQITKNPWETASEKFAVGTKVKGSIRNIADFGLFIGLLPELDGLVHISDLSWVRIVRPLAEIYHKGDELEAIVLNLEVENERLSLGVKQLTEDPWGKIKKLYPIGKRSEGTVLWVGPKMIAVGLEEGVEALWDLSEEEETPPQHSIGERLSVVIHSLDERERKILVGPYVEEESAKVKSKKKK
ncbi:MAG: 30S ribosomal protein S1 [Deltaproteobacteria bacterium]|nr:30S ribosomal protein S1 [Deltaproteobacteria bacterium]MBI4374384.1 30S ribosomal protein S1 [Deltaproteobacteria bacterium]